MMLAKSMMRHPVSLIEVLIAVALTVGILMTLTFFYRQVTLIGIEADQVSQKNFNMRYIESRLAAVLPKAISEMNKKNDFIFFSFEDEGLNKAGSQSLIFTFDNQVSLDKTFSNHVLARLYLDKEGNLMLAYWPSPKRWEQNVMPSMKKELLLEGADNLHFEFYIAPKKNDKETSFHPEKNSSEAENENTESNQAQEKKREEKLDKEENVEPEPKGSWRRQNWLQDYKQLPVMIKIIVTMPKGSEPLIFIYPLANAKSHVIYE